MPHTLNMHLYTCEGCFTTFGVEDHEEQDQSQLVCPNCQTDVFLEDAGYGFFTQTKLPEGIQITRQLMEEIAAQHGFNFLHPDVLQISQQLDLLILQAMRMSKRP